MIEEKKRKEIVFEYAPMAITAIGIIVCAIAFQQKLIKTLPVLFSLMIMLFNSRANRIGFLLGAMNSVIYIIGYLMEGVYGTVLSTAFGIVMALAAYFRWKKDSYGKATTFRTFSLRGRIILASLIAVAWGVSAFVLWKTGGEAFVFDGIVLVLGVLLPILNIWAFVESAFLNVISCLMQAVMWLVIIVTKNNFANLTYLIYMAYATYMVSRMFLRWVSLYKEQRAASKAVKQNDNIGQVSE